MALITVPALYSCGNWNQYHIIYHQVSLIFDNRRPLVINHLAEICYMLAFFTILHIFISFSLVTPHTTEGKFELYY